MMQNKMKSVVLAIACLLLYDATADAQQANNKTTPKQSKQKADSIPYRTTSVRLWNRTITKNENVAAVSSLAAHDVNSTPVADISNVMAGRLSGLYTVQNSGRTGNDASYFSLRGQTPLIVVDGVIRNFTSFNPNDIKSITVLKDAVATSMYGLRSSKGVVMITTKESSESSPFEMNFSAQYGMLKQLKTPSFITGYNYAVLYNEAQANTFPGSTPAYSAADLQAYQNKTNDVYKQPNVNWYKEVYKPATAQQRYSMDFSGNGSMFRYFASLEYFNQPGGFVTSSANKYNTNDAYQRYTVRVNTQTDFNKTIRLNLNLYGASENYNEPGAGASNIMGRIYTTSPLAYPVRNADSSFGGNTNWTNNILASTISSGYIQYNNRNVNADVALRFNLDNVTKGLWAKTILSINNYYIESVNRSKTFAVYNPVYDPVTGNVSSYSKIGTDGRISAGSGSRGIGSQFKQTFVNGLIGYDKSIGKNNINLLGTYNYDNYIGSFTQLNQIYQTAGITASYNYDKTYMAELGLAYSGLNRYAPGHRWGFLPSLGLGWVLSKESWYNQSSAINYLKVRSSVGQTAWADPNNYFIYLQNYAGATGYNFGSTPTAVSGVAESSLASKNLSWEKAWKYDAGIEAVLFHNLLTVSLDYYFNHHYDELQQRFGGNGTGMLGQTYPLENLRQTNYTGFETTVEYEHSFSNNIKLGAKGNFSLAKSKLLYANEGIYPYPWMRSEGGTVNQVFGYVANGFYQSTDNISTMANMPGYTPQAGDIRYKDLNSDGVINNLDRETIANKKPVMFYGLDLFASWKNFDLNMLLQGVGNREVVLSPSSMLAFSNGYGYVLNYTTANRWSSANNTNATLPRLTLGNNVNNSAVSTFWVRKANYLRLKNLEIGYNLPAEKAAHLKLRGARLFVNGYNLVTMSSLKDLDPESVLGYFSNQRIINFGLNIKL